MDSFLKKQEMVFSMVLKQIDFLEVLTQLNWSESNDLEFKAAQGGIP